MRQYWGESMRCKGNVRVFFSQVVDVSDGHFIWRAIRRRKRDLHDILFPLYLNATLDVRNWEHGEALGGYQIPGCFLGSL